MLPRRIMSWGVLALLTAVLLAAPAAAQESSEVTVKRDGDSFVLIPKDPKKAYLVVGIPRDEKGGKQEAGTLAYLTGEQRIPAKDLKRVVVLELKPVTQLDVSYTKGGFQWKQNPCDEMTCVVPLPRCPPSCPQAYLLWKDLADLQPPPPK
jgi:hypothetical protein